MKGPDFVDFITRIRGLLQAGLPPKTVKELADSLGTVEGEAKDATTFEGLPLDKQKDLERRLIRILQEATRFGDGSLDETDIMAKELASSSAVWIIGFLAAATTLILIIAVVRLWGDATRATSACNPEPTVVQSPSGKPAAAPAEQKSGSIGTGSPATPPASSAATPAAGAAAGGTGGAGGTAAGPSGTAGGGNAPGAARPPDKQPEVTPSQATLGTCQSVALRVSGAAADAEVAWSPAPTGSLSNDGVYTAPSSIAGQQTVTVTATVKPASGQPQTAKSANIVLMPPGGPDERNVLLMIVLMGALGGCLHWLSGFAFFVGNREFLRSWIAYYVLMPLEGAALAIIVYLLLRVGILSPASVGSAATSNLNTVGLYAFAGLTGIYSKQALVSLGDVFNVIFTKVKAKDEAKSEAGKTDPKTGNTKT